MAFERTLISSICASVRDGMSISSMTMSRTAIEVLLQPLDAYLPSGLADVGLEPERLVDTEHRVVRIRVPRPDVDDLRTLAHQPLEVHGLEPLAQGVSAMFRTHRGPALVEGVGLALGVVEELGEADEPAG